MGGWVNSWVWGMSGARDAWVNGWLNQLSHFPESEGFPGCRIFKTNIEAVCSKLGSYSP